MKKFTNLKIIIEESKKRKELRNISFLKAFKYEIDLFLIMGPNLYIKYSKGTAVEGVDFW